MASDIEPRPQPFKCRRDADRRGSRRDKGSLPQQAQKRYRRPEVPFAMMVSLPQMYT